MSKIHSAVKGWVEGRDKPSKYPSPHFDFYKSLCKKYANIEMSDPTWLSMFEMEQESLLG